MKRLLCFLLLLSCPAFPQSVFGPGAVSALGAPVVLEPAFSLAAGTYSSAQTLTLSCPTGKTAFYTTNGYPVNDASTEYTGPIAISASETVNAECVTAGSINQNVQESSSGWKCNAGPSSTITTSNGWTCNTTAPNGASGALSAWNFTPGTIGNITATAPANGAGQILFIYGGPACNSCTNLTQHLLYEPTANNSVIENNESDMEQCCDVTTHALHQASLQCNQHSNYVWEINASGPWLPTTISCGPPTNSYTDVVYQAHWINGDTGGNGYGIMYLDALTINGVTYAPLSAYCAASDPGCAVQAMIAKPSYGNFVGNQQQIDLVSSSSSITGGRNLEIDNVTASYGDATYNSATYTIQ